MKFHTVVCKTPCALAFRLTRSTFTHDILCSGNGSAVHQSGFSLARQNFDYGNAGIQSIFGAFRSYD